MKKRTKSLTHHSYHVRGAGPNDLADLAKPILSCGLFSPEEAEGFLGQLPDLLSDPGRIWLRLDHGEHIAGAAYLSRDGLSEDVWNLWFIGLDPAHHGRGGGRTLLRAAEDAARQAKARLMLVETSSDPDQAPARRFYAAAGYAQQATITDYYADGVDKVIFVKVL